MEDPTEQILAFLRAQREPARTLDIAKAVYGEGAIAKQVNPWLYKLQGAKMVAKTAEPDGTNPRWSVSSEAAEREERRAAVLEQLRSAREPMSTLTIARSVVGASAKAKDVNPHLYDLERAGLIVKGTDEEGKNVRWSVRS